MTKQNHKNKPLRTQPARTSPIYGLIGEVTLLDQDFDDVDEMLIFDPPVRCIRGGHVTLVDKDPEDGPEE